MTLQTVTDQFRQQAGKLPPTGKSLKFVFDLGVVYLDMTGDQTVVTNEDRPADTEIITSVDTLEQIRSGQLNPMMAVMSGKVKIKGDMGQAMKLQSLLS